MGKSNSKAKQTVLKPAFVQSYKRFLGRQLTTLLRGEKVTLRDTDIWDFFKANQDFLIAFAAVTGRTVLAGVGTYEFIICGDNKASFRYRIPERYRTFFKEHQELIDIEGENSGLHYFEQAYQVVLALRAEKLRGKEKDLDETLGGELELVEDVESNFEDSL